MLKAKTLSLFLGAAAVFAAIQPASAGYVTWYITNSNGDIGSGATFAEETACTPAETCTQPSGDITANILTITGSFDYDANYLIDLVPQFANVNITTTNSNPGVAVLPDQVGNWYIDPAVGESGAFGFVSTADSDPSPTHDFSGALAFSLQSFGPGGGGDSDLAPCAGLGCLLDTPGATMVYLDFGVDGSCADAPCANVAANMPNGFLLDGAFINGNFVPPCTEDCGGGGSSSTPEPTTFILGGTVLAAGLIRRKIYSRS